MNKKITLRNYLVCVNQQIISKCQSILNSDFGCNNCKTNWRFHNLLCLFHLGILGYSEIRLKGEEFITFAVKSVQLLLASCVSLMPARKEF